MRTATKDNQRLVDAYLDWQSSTRNCSPHTYAAYSGTLNKLVVHLGANTLGCGVGGGPGGVRGAPQGAA